MRSLGKGVCQPQCESVKVLSPEIFLVALGQGFHFLEASIGMHIKGECISDVSGSESVAGNELSMLELGRTESLLTEAVKEPKKRRSSMAFR